ncbi:Phosphoinositide 3-kinase family, accessory domain (PIK domain) protein [Candida parapsilosis]|uniref:Phosphoinositide 3-kinase family, accessory domain (PIK domain) protein n=1 Tax=Candida parapsilosis TaxID=5480 RepID=A0A8X7NQU4_CANPA|nr:Phosphoinositide 3-kinase family, accessory domain (PIK domain) protein [Candida parapsilosis]KAF6056298.1 Phosphoinositide 3-kinase family, accessory domain (PIK domain) protein [Candida parapsilosis]KAF6057973.1 Phosphoinositide 3-kinase family, accessory domain (PIK domain) protein [Candida parapsilosis]KAF6059231.1 Phosphoinositide 3-kinase family, accessory domain (PIK domain) protein [Candida parapsilosis]KAF6067988.1 Phosphoinositide 3-kinase family, accessory domain (PIK domain) prot
MRSLETHDVNFTSFYVTRTVQSLCHDAKNYVESFIFDTTEELRLFAYQIIWNMLASSYKDDDSTELDDLKLKMELTAYGETWQGTTEVETWKWHFAISKVGDDCRHMLTAAAPGCDVIVVLPKSNFKDMLRREAVNGLFCLIVK